MDKKKRNIGLILWFLVMAVLLAGSLMSHGIEKHETVQEAMKDAVLHETGRISLFGILTVNPGLICAFTVTGTLLVLALVIRVFVIPKFTLVPGKVQLLIETLVGTFDNMARVNSPKRNKFLGAYLFTTACYVFVGTLFELFGLQAVTVSGHSIALSAPLSDINAAISLGCLSYIVILSGGLCQNGFKGVLATLKDFSLPISMSFRLFGALLSGLLVTELVYYYFTLSFVLPVVVAVLFTLMHALIQSYVLTMLTALFYGEVAE